MQLWDSDSARFLDRQRHHPSRRRWSPALRQSVGDCSNWSTDPIGVRTAKEHKRAPKLTKKEIENTQKLLQFQTDGFVQSLEIQSLRNNVTHLLEARSRAEDGYRQFQSELKVLEQEVLVNDKPAVLDYTLSEEDWLDIIER
jgi:hypothetical protein